MDRLLALPASIVFLCIAIAFYAVLGSPTPDNPGIAEIIVGVLLVLSILTGAAGRGLSFLIGRNFYLKSIQVLFLCGLILPAFSGMYFGNDMMLMLRDVIAFSFLAMPLFLSEKIANHDGADKILRGFVLFAGVAFAIRTLMPAFNVWIPEGELLYLSNSPLCLFAAVFFACMLFHELMDIKAARAGRSIAMFAGLCVILAAMLLDVQRATIGAVILSVAVYALAAIISTPKKAVLPILIIMGMGALAYPVIADTMGVIVQKTASVGWNMRLQEARAVFDYLCAEPVRFFLGAGWGATFASPAVGGIDVNYTHSFLTTMVLKGGIVLLLVAIIAVVAAMSRIFLIFQRDKAMGLALFWPLVIPVFLYASHKSLDFALILLLIGVGSILGQALHPAHPSDKKHETLI